MAWYLSEVSSDLSPIIDILELYDRMGAFPKDVFIDEYKKHLVSLLRRTSFNTDHIDADDIPAVYENDEYKWLAVGYHDLIHSLGLIDLRGNEQNEYSFALTEAGRRVLKQSLSLPEHLRVALPKWSNDVGINPYPIIRGLARNLNLYPCAGLLLLEVLIVLIQLNQPYGHINIEGVLESKRKEFYKSGNMTGERSVDLVNYSGFLWEDLSQDLSNYYAANYPARATLQLMLYAGDLTYGPVPDEIFGLIQYVTST